MIRKLHAQTDFDSNTNLNPMSTRIRLISNLWGNHIQIYHEKESYTYIHLDFGVRKKETHNNNKAFILKFRGQLHKSFSSI